MPQRTSVLHASLQAKWPADLKISRWSHALLGKGTERREGDQVVWSLELKDQAPRRLESGVPAAERDVAITFGTQSWFNVWRSYGELTRSLELAGDPAVAAFARSASEGQTRPTKELLGKLVTAIGKKVRVASGGELSDGSAAYGDGPHRSSARTTLEMGQGSRTWLMRSVLQELGIASELVVSETEPFASDPNFPPHLGRFKSPLLVVKVDGGEEVWLDLDVSGPPLPPGYISPELSGRLALRTSTGEISPVPPGVSAGPDEIDIKLTVGSDGDARGTVENHAARAGCAGVARRIRNAGRVRPHRHAAVGRAGMDPVGKRGRRAALFAGRDLAIRPEGDGVHSGIRAA